MRYSIIVPSFNHLEDCLKPCINSVLANTDLVEGDGEIVIVLNGCTDDSLKWCQSLIELHGKTLGNRIRILDSSKALGYTRATNWGIRESTGEYIILLNNDVEILDCFTKNYWVDKLIEGFQDKRVGVTGVTKVWDKNSGWDFIIFYCACLRRDLVLEFGALDEIFSPGGCEDIEYCIRLQKRGYRIVGLGEERAEWRYGAEYPIYHKGERTVWGLRDWDDIWKRNTEIIGKYRDEVKYSIYVDGKGEVEIEGRLDSIRRNTSFNDKEIVFANCYEDLYNRIKEYGPYRLVDINDWNKGYDGIKLIYINGRVVDSEVDEWIRDIDMGIGVVCDYSCNQFIGDSLLGVGDIWWVGVSEPSFILGDMGNKVYKFKEARYIVK